MDDEIDDVARTMMAALPSAALRTRIRDRIAGRPAVSPVLRWSVGVAAAATVIVLAIVWPSREAPVDIPPSRESIATIVPPPAIDPSAQPRQTEPRAVVGRALSGSPGEPNPPSPTGFGEARPTDEKPFADETMAFLGPLVIEPLMDLEPIELSGIEISTLAVEAMTVAPLSQQ
jgi:hypothetical protein